LPTSSLLSLTTDAGRAWTASKATHAAHIHFLRLTQILTLTSARFPPADILLLLQAVTPIQSVRNEREFVMELRKL